MLSKEELLKNIDELYEACLESEAERLRLRSLNASLREGLADYAEICKGKISERDEEITTLRREIETLRANPPQVATSQQGKTSPQKAITLLLSPLPRDFLFIGNATDNIGGIALSNFWQEYIRRYPATGVNIRYRLFIGYLYERRGWRVYYEDDNKRIICHKETSLVMIATEDGGIMNINTLYALASRAISLKIDYPDFDVSAVCITSGTLSDKAKTVARKFLISAKEDFPFQNFPYVKCKVLPDRKVYYTPNDKEYFTTRIIPANDDIFCRTMNDALVAGFQPS